MKIEIHSVDGSGVYGYYLYSDNKRIRNIRRNVRPFDFDENDILNLIGERKYKEFENGKYIFEVTNHHLQLITGERSARTKQELELYP